MAGRVNVLFASGFEPKHIAAITFTEFAASELRSRIDRFATALSKGDVPNDLAGALVSRFGQRGLCTLVRFADDAVMAFEDFLDAKRVLGVLGQRLARYGLTLHPDKTRVVDFRNTRPNGMNHPETDGTSFTFLGFTHIWGKSRAGKNVVRQVTAKNRYARALAAVTAWCRSNRHQSIPDQHAHLTAMMRGHYAYYGITGNSRRISWYAR